MDITHSITPRGFSSVGFLDRGGEPCSLQESSLATEAAVWFGASALRVDAFPSKSETGWDPINVHALVSDLGYRDFTSNARMHLTQTQMQALLAHLTRFAVHGDVPPTPTRPTPSWRKGITETVLPWPKRKTAITLSTLLVHAGLFAMRDAAKAAIARGTTTINGAPIPGGDPRVPIEDLIGGVLLACNGAKAYVRTTR